jgi:hypothetical protein
MMPRWWSISHVNPRFLHAALVAAALIFSSQLALAEFTQQGPKLVGTGAVGYATQGYSVSISRDNDTAIVGGPDAATNSTGAVWVFIRGNNAWTQQDDKLIGNGAARHLAPAQGYSVAASGDGNTAIVGGRSDDDNAGAPWVFIRRPECS